MNDEKPGSPLKDFEGLFAKYWQDIAVDQIPAGRIEYAVALLIKSVERLKLSTEQSSREANRLSSAVKELTAWLVALTAVAVVLAGLSLYVLFSSAK